jgi:hypothetical protein
MHRIGYISTVEFPDDGDQVMSMNNDYWYLPLSDFPQRIDCSIVSSWLYYRKERQESYKTGRTERAKCELFHAVCAQELQTILILT